MTEEHKEKMRVGNKAYFAKRRAAKALLPQPESIYAPSKNPILQSPEEKNVDLSSARHKVNKKVFSKLFKLIDSQLDIAIGYFYETADGKHIYQKQPNGATGEYLLNQLIGKPKESIEIKTKNLNLDV